jgi:hypothetical protein
MAIARPGKAILALLAGSLFTAAWAEDGLIPDAALKYAPVQAPTLVSRPDIAFRLAQVQRGPGRLTILAHQDSAGQPVPVATMWSSASGKEVRLTLLKAAGAAGDLKLATLEHVYAMVLRQEPKARYCMDDGAERCQSHAEALRLLALSRQQAARGDGNRQWSVVSLSPVAVDSGDDHDVGVRVTTEQGTLEGVSVFFDRAPHFSCVAKSGKDGVATCQLIDQHGEEESHADEAPMPTVATFPGNVRPERVWAPTTLVLEPRS